MGHNLRARRVSWAGVLSALLFVLWRDLRGLRLCSKDEKCVLMQVCGWEVCAGFYMGRMRFLLLSGREPRYGYMVTRSVAQCVTRGFAGMLFTFNWSLVTVVRAVGAARHRHTVPVVGNGPQVTGGAAHCGGGGDGKVE